MLLHLKSHLEKLPASDFRSREVLEQMVLDEEAHGDEAGALGAKPLRALFAGQCAFVDEY